MSFGDEFDELCPIPLSVAPTRTQREMWNETAESEGLDLHTWMIKTLNKAAGKQQTWFERRMMQTR